MIEGFDRVESKDLDCLIVDMLRTSRCCRKRSLGWLCLERIEFFSAIIGKNRGSFDCARIHSLVKQNLSPRFAQDDGLREKRL